MKLEHLLKTFSQRTPESIRQYAWILGKPYETLRRLIKRLSSEELRREHARRVLTNWAKDKDVVIVAIDPTYINGREEGILVASLVVGRGRSIPLYWELFSWKEIRNRETDSRNLFQMRFVKKLKELVYPKKLLIIADREFGRKSFLKFLKKKGIYWVIRHPKNSWPPACGKGIVIPGPSEDYLLSYRLPYELQEADPVELYLMRMTIEETFRDAKSLLRLVELLKGVKDPQVKGGLAFLVFASLVYARSLAEKALNLSRKLLNLPNSFWGLLRRGYYSITYFGRLCAMKMGDNSMCAVDLGASLEPEEG